MKVLLVANYLHDTQESMQRFAAMMKRGLMEAGHEVRVCRPPAILGRLRPSGRGVGKWLGYVDKFAVFPIPLRAAAEWADVVHICDHSNSFYVERLRSRPHVVTCHDVFAIQSALGQIPQIQTRWTGRQLQRMILKGLLQAQHIACVSEATRFELLRVSSIPERNVSRIYNGLNYPYRRMAAQEAATQIRKFGIDPGQSFVLHVGANLWYKNRLGVLRIFSCLRRRGVGQNLKLVMVGSPWTAEMRRFVSEHSLGDAVSELTDVAEEGLRALYSTAAMMLFPSLREGFGWPILEAQACGCPVATSNRSPMDEVGGSAAVYVDPENAESAAATVALALERVADMREASVQNAARFGTSAMISSYISLYKKLSDENSPHH
jgi:glycosyltransferase involved in cell wall biosynthesis